MNAVGALHTTGSRNVSRKTSSKVTDSWPSPACQNETATLVATLERPTDVSRLSSVRRVADWLEHRADLAPEVGLGRLRSHFHGRLLFTLRSAREGGACVLEPDGRRTRLCRAARDYDLVDLETDDLVPTVLDAIAPERRVISWHGRAVDRHDLIRRLHRLSATPALLYRLVSDARASGDELAPLQLLETARRSDVVAFAAGPIGQWTRLVAPHLGARAVFGAIDDNDHGTPTVDRLVSDYDLPRMRPVDEVFGIVGDPVLSSLSPRVHNAAFQSLGLRALYLPFHAPSFSAFWSGVVASGALDGLGRRLRGLCVVSPHKECALAAAQERSPMVERARSTNFFARHGASWTADTTDPGGVLEPLFDRRVSVHGARAAVIGCGGSGRAVAAALHDAGASVTLVNRGLERGLRAAELLRLPYRPLSRFSPEGYSIVVNATPVGREGEPAPFAVDRLSPDAVVVDLVYGKRPTPLVAASLLGGRVVVDGRDVVMAQASRQFRLMTGRAMPEPLVRQILGLESTALAAASGQ